MAGDELVWAQFHKERNREIVPWFPPPGTMMSMDHAVFRNEYIDYRRNFNLPYILCNELGTDRVDLSHDGKSNDNIAIETIAFLLSLPKEERKNYHVVIGWTSLSRILKYSPDAKHFVDLTAGHYDQEISDPAKVALKNHIKTRILDGDDVDFIQDYLSNVMLLENFLIANEVTYTFYRGVDDWMFDFATLGPFAFFSEYIIQVSACTDHTNWYSFSDDKRLPINGVGWSSFMRDNTSNWVTTSNCHPSASSMIDFAEKLAAFIKQQNVL